jgi:hypothetical protein
MWHRVFCRSAAEVLPAELLARVQAPGRTVEGRFKGDDLGWTAAEFDLGAGTPVHAERYLTDTDDIRDDLNTWAAWLETMDFSPHHGPLMERVVQTKQMVTIRRPADHPNESAVEDVCRTLCRVLAEARDGVYQIDGAGWFAADGTLLLEEY